MKTSVKQSTDDAFDATKLDDLSFWFDPYSIPRYNWLVAEGLVTQELADQYRDDRHARGLPMTFADLKARPAPEFEWLASAGGPVVTCTGEVIDLDGEHWATSCYSTTGQLSFYPPALNAGDGFCSVEISAGRHDYGAVRWNTSYKVPNGDLVYARCYDFASTFSEALAAAREQVFNQVIIAGIAGYPAGQKGGDWVAAGPGGQELSVRYIEYGDEPRWLWEFNLAEGSVAWRIAREFGEHRFQGSAGTRDDAVVAALAATERLLSLAGELVGGDTFVAGVAAGRAALKSEIANL